MPDLDPALPFALLWDAERRGARLFTDTLGVIAGTDTAAGLATMRAAIGRGEWLAGGLSYEAGLALEPRTTALARGPGFHWFARFGAPRFLRAGEVATLLEGWRAPVTLGPVQPLVDRAHWMTAVRQAQRFIAAGDIYQANLTFPAELSVAGHPLALFAHLFAPPDAPLNVAPHGGVVHDGAGRWWLSLSPELFFQLDNDQLTARPMKGTAARGATPEVDRMAARTLAADAKNRAENLMITDLLRNDLARVAQPGSVSVSDLFTIETYPSIHQMTSTVTARLGDDHDAIDALRTLFPCGSITGAPKIRAMEVIAELEAHPRGIYCGAIGWTGPEAAHFNVAIRTLAIDTAEHPGVARLGLGAGIVADSIAEAEWDECLTKARFLAPSRPDTLVETMRIAADGTIPRMARHVARITASARHFGVPVDPTILTANLTTLHPESACRLRLVLHADGRFAIALSALPAAPAGPVAVAIQPLPLAPDDWRLRHKSEARDFHTLAHQTGGRFETIYERADGLLTEGSFTNIFVERDGVLLTPPADLGLLPGVLRAELLDSGRAREAPLRRADLAGGFRIGNSLRGLIPARLG